MVWFVLLVGSFVAVAVLLWLNYPRGLWWMAALNGVIAVVLIALVMATIPEGECDPHYSGMQLGESGCGIRGLDATAVMMIFGGAALVWALLAAAKTYQQQRRSPRPRRPTPAGAHPTVVPPGKSKWSGVYASGIQPGWRIRVTQPSSPGPSGNSEEMTLRVGRVERIGSRVRISFADGTTQVFNHRDWVERVADRRGRAKRTKAG